MDSYKCKAATIMLIENDPGDQKLVRLSFRKQHIANELVVVENGEQALDYLHDCKGYGEMPELILLDLNTPGMCGREFLKKIKSDKELSFIPVVILTTSDSDADILDSFKLQVAGYIKKVADIEDFMRMMKNLTDYWFTICKRVDCAGSEKPECAVKG
ncbi:MAG: response regulator [Anaerohalosphaeraceae bacterium]|nr:response regulator [Anaerohalosphaeraceae bacterium]